MNSLDKDNEILGREYNKKVSEKADILIDANTFEVYRNNSDFKLDKLIDFETAITLLNSKFTKVAVVFSKDKQDLIVDSNFEVNTHLK